MNFDNYKVTFDIPKPVKPSVPTDLLDVKALNEYTEKVKEYNIDLQKYKEKEKEFKEKQNEAKIRYMNDLAKENGIDDLPKEIQQMVFNKAYEDGHSSGYYEVASIYAELAEFVLKIIQIMKK